ncbi:restriction endonuclease subunit S [Pseudomonas abietaniphila]|uniref:Type I restriction enzyme, S subunit n=1 Tax=Pseudomonas abietaniphila TaxID=89065 RepID=A0A1G8EVM6_9PSED|nr:restriction endonuclease subunit S [Pseudomonas abietaniphila]SDH73961.1 type I restriction enzyme, S subunit [Pseudomonas abietaniphila]
MSSDWQTTSVEDIAAKRSSAMATGPFGSSISSKYFQAEGVPVIRGSNLSADIQIKLDDSGLVFVSNEKAREFDRCLVGKGDLIFTCWGTINQIGLIDGDAAYENYIISNKQMKLTVDEQRVDPRFVYYVFSGPEKQAEIIDNGIGSSVPGFNLGQLRKHQLLLPTLHEQKAIADTLDLFTDRITLLRETNATLEAIAQALFKSWFVDFDPVRAKAEGRQPEGMGATTAALFPDSFEKSELGLVPKGWCYSTVGLSFVLTMGQSPPGDTYNETGEGLPFYQGRTDFGFRFPKQRIFCTEPTRLAGAGDTLVSVRAPVGDVNIALEACALGRGVAGLRHPEGHQSFVFYAVRCLKPYFEMYDGEGTVFGSINKKDFQSLPVVVPSAEVLSAFEAVVAPLDAAVENNEQKLRSLTQLRDTLLPRLISGQLRLPDAEQAVEEALA